MLACRFNLSASFSQPTLPPSLPPFFPSLPLGHYHIHATIPEKVHTLQVHLSQSPGTITLPKKIEGESIDLLSKEGDVLLNKIRGDEGRAGGREVKGGEASCE